MQQAAAASSKAAIGRVQVFEYPADPDAPLMPEWSGWANADESVSPSSPESGAAGGDLRQHPEFDKRLTEETRRSFDSGRERGRQEGRQQEREAQAAAQTTAERERARQAAGLIESFTQERDRFLHTVEEEVVKLSLAVAARILRREAQMDPLLLTGAVRVALGQLSASTQVRLRVPPAELELWKEAVALLPGLAVKPAVLAGEGMRLGDCAIETEMCTVDLGIRAQLSEIERGFFDREGGIGSNHARPEILFAEAEPKAGVATAPVAESRR